MILSFTHYVILFCAKCPSKLKRILLSKLICADCFLLFVFIIDSKYFLKNALLEFVRVVKSQHQVVSGTLHHLTIEAIDAGKKKLYEAKVWVKPWLNSKELQEFNHIGDAPTFTPSDLGVKKGRWGFVSL